MLHAKDLKAHFYWGNADGPLDVRVYGRYTKEGLIIHGVTLNNTYPRDKPTTSLLPRPIDLVRLALVQLRKDLLNGDQIEITTPARPPSIDAWDGVLKPGPLRQCYRGYRLEWRPAGPGRPEGSDTSPTLTEMEQALRELNPRHPKWPPKKAFMQKLGRSHENERRVNDWLKPHGLNYTKFVKQFYPARHA
jgi:hypothetical protein